MLRTRLHLLFLFSGLGAAVFLGIHLAVQLLNHILAAGDPDPNSWNSMLSRATQGSWIAVYIFLLVFGLYHGLYGLRGIILEMTTSDQVERVINWSFIIGGLMIFGWAVYVPVVFAVR